MSSKVTDLCLPKTFPEISSKKYANIIIRGGIEKGYTGYTNSSGFILQKITSNTRWNVKPTISSSVSAKVIASD